MTLTPEAKKTICLVDKYSLVIPPGLKWWADGSPGRRVLFITDPQEIFIVSFEEGMRLMDNVPRIAPKYRRKVFYGEKRREIGSILRSNPLNG